MGPLKKIEVRVSWATWALPVFVAHNVMFDATMIVIGPVSIEINWFQPWRW